MKLSDLRNYFEGFISQDTALLFSRKGFTYLQQLEYSQTFLELEWLITELDELPLDISEEFINNKVIEFLANRWQRIQSTNSAYTQDNYHPANQLCTGLANELEIATGTSYLFWLMRTLDANHIPGLNERKPITHYILSDDNRELIDIYACLTHFANTGSFSQGRVLSDNEIKRISNHSVSIKKFIIQARKGKANQPTPHNILDEIYSPTYNNDAQSLVLRHLIQHPIKPFYLISRIGFNNIFSELSINDKKFLFDNLLSSGQNVQEFLAPTIKNMKDLKKLCESLSRLVCFDLLTQTKFLETFLKVEKRAEKERLVPTLFSLLNLVNDPKEVLESIDSTILEPYLQFNSDLRKILNPIIVIDISDESSSSHNDSSAESSEDSSASDVESSVDSNESSSSISDSSNEFELSNPSPESSSYSDEWNMQIDDEPSSSSSDDVKKTVATAPEMIIINLDDDEPLSEEILDESVLSDTENFDTPTPTFDFIQTTTSVSTSTTTTQEFTIQKESDNHYHVTEFSRSVEKKSEKIESTIPFNMDDLDSDDRALFEFDSSDDEAPKKHPQGTKRKMDEFEHDSIPHSPNKAARMEEKTPTPTSLSVTSVSLFSQTQVTSSGYKIQLTKIYDQINGQFHCSKKLYLKEDQKSEKPFKAAPFLEIFYFVNQAYELIKKDIHDQEKVAVEMARLKKPAMDALNHLIEAYTRSDFETIFNKYKNNPEVLKKQMEIHGISIEDTFKIRSAIAKRSHYISHYSKQEFTPIWIQSMNTILGSFFSDIDFEKRLAINTFVNEFQFELDRLNIQVTKLGKKS